jgi:hypothetical protein
MTSSVTKIEPIRKTRRVPLAPEAAFDLFTSRMMEWWPVGQHSIAGEDVVELRFERRTGGRLIEVDRNGNEVAWADILVWEPPHRVRVAWHPDREPVADSILEVRFIADGSGSILELAHSGWEAFGPKGSDLRTHYEPGWENVLAAYEEVASDA